MNNPLFNSVDQALTVHHRFIARLGALAMWTIFAIIHLTIAVICLALLWWFQLTPVQVVECWEYISQSFPAVVFSALGGSAAGLVAFYSWLIRKLHRASGSPLADYLMKGFEKCHYAASAVLGRVSRLSTVELKALTQPIPTWIPMKIDLTFELTENAKQRTPEDFSIVNHPMPTLPFPDRHDFVCFTHAGKTYEFRVEKRQFNYLPDGELDLVILLS